MYGAQLLYAMHRRLYSVAPRVLCIISEIISSGHSHLSGFPHWPKFACMYFIEISKRHCNAILKNELTGLTHVATRSAMHSLYIDSLVQDCSISIANSLEVHQSCIKLSMYNILQNLSVNINTSLKSKMVRYYLNVCLCNYDWFTYLFHNLYPQNNVRIHWNTGVYTVELNQMVSNNTIEKSVYTSPIYKNASVLQNCLLISHPWLTLYPSKYPLILTFHTHRDSMKTRPAVILLVSAKTPERQLRIIIK